MANLKLEDALELSVMCGALSESFDSTIDSTKQDQKYFNSPPLSTKAILKDITLYFFNDKNPQNWLNKNILNTIQKRRLVIFEIIGEKIVGKGSDIEKGIKYLRKRIIHSYQFIQEEYQDEDKLSKSFQQLSEMFNSYN